MNLLKSGLKQWELVMEAFAILVHAAYLNRFLLRLSFPQLMEVRADIRGEMHYGGWRDLNYGPCYWIDLARHWIPANLTVCTHSAVPSSDNQEFVPAVCFVTVLFATVTCVHCVILSCVMVKNGQGKLLKPANFYPQIRGFIEARGMFRGLAMLLLFKLLVVFSILGPYYIISCGISWILRFFGDAALLPGGTLLLLCLMVYNILGLLGVWNVRSRYEQVATLVRLQSPPTRPAQAPPRYPFRPETVGMQLLQRIATSGARLGFGFGGLCARGLSIRLGYPDTSVAFSSGWWSGLLGPVRTAPKGLEELRLNDARLSRWYNITEKYADPSHHPGLTDPVSPLAYIVGSSGWYLGELYLWCFLGIFSTAIFVGFICFTELVAIQIREYFWWKQSRQYIEADAEYSRGLLRPLSDEAVVTQLLVLNNLLSATRTLWTAPVVIEVVLLLVPEQWYLPGYLLFMLWLTGEVAKAGRSLIKRVKAFAAYLDAQDGIWV